MTLGLNYDVLLSANDDLAGNQFYTHGRAVGRRRCLSLFYFTAGLLSVRRLFDHCGSIMDSTTYKKRTSIAYQYTSYHLKQKSVTDVFIIRLCQLDFFSPLH